MPGDGELALQEDWLCREFALQGNVVQARAGQASKCKPGLIYSAVYSLKY